MHTWAKFTFNAFGISLLLCIAAVELTLILRHRPGKAVVNDMKTNVVLGALYTGSGFLVKGMEFGLFALCYKFAFFKPELSWWLWIVGFLGCDFMHYAYHWLGHKTQLFWAAHVTHHSSEHFNISTAFRNNFLHVFYRFLFWSPLCFFGIPPEMVLLFESLTAIQNFVVHTEKIRKLGALDWWFNTPSNHRVHHGTNPEYIDKNLGGVLMLYDHLFGTYAKEIEPPVYGLTHNIHTHNPATIILHEYVRMTRKVATIKGVSRKLRYLLSRPQ